MVKEITLLIMDILYSIAVDKTRFYQIFILNLQRNWRVIFYYIFHFFSLSFLLSFSLAFSLSFFFSLLLQQHSLPCSRAMQLVMTPLTITPPHFLHKYLFIISLPAFSISFSYFSSSSLS